MITLTGLDSTSFKYILDKFGPFYDSYTPFTQNVMIKSLVLSAEALEFLTLKTLLALFLHGIVLVVL